MKHLLILLLFPAVLFAQDLPDQEVEARGRQRSTAPTALRPDIRNLLPSVPALHPKQPVAKDSLMPTLTRLSLSNGAQSTPTVYAQSSLKGYAGLGQFLSRKLGGMAEYALFPKALVFANMDYDGSNGFGAYPNQAIKANRNVLDLGGGLRFSGKNLGGKIEATAFNNRQTQYQTLINSVVTPNIQLSPTKKIREEGLSLQLQNASCNPLQFTQRFGFTQFNASNAFTAEAATQFNQKSDETRWVWQPQFLLPFEGFQGFLNGNASRGKVQNETLKDQIFNLHTGIKLTKSPLFKVDLGFALTRFATKNAANTQLYERNYYMPILGIESILDRNLILYAKHEPITHIRTGKEIALMNSFLAQITEIRPQISPIHFRGGAVWGTQLAEVKIEAAYEKSDETLIFKSINNNGAFSPSYTQADIYSLSTATRFRFSEFADASLNVKIRNGKQSNLNAPNRAIPFFSPLVIGGGFKLIEKQSKASFKTDFHIEGKASITENLTHTLKPFLNFASEILVPIKPQLGVFMQFNQNRHRFEGINGARKNPPTLLVGITFLNAGTRER